METEETKTGVIKRKPQNVLDLILDLRSLGWSREVVDAISEEVGMRTWAIARTSAPNVFAIVRVVNRGKLDELTFVDENGGVVGVETKLETLKQQLKQKLAQGVQQHTQGEFE